MIRWSISSTIFFLTLCSVQSTFGAAELSEQFRKKYSTIRSFSCEFYGAEGIHGTIAAVKGGGYKIELPNRTIISDGKVVWNADKASKTTIINKYNPHNNESSLDQIFFVLFNVYTCSTISNTSQKMSVKLTPPGPNAVIANVSEIVVSLKKGLTLSSIRIVQDNSSTQWVIDKAKINPKIPAKTFTYSAPKGWQVVDLR